MTIEDRYNRLKRLCSEENNEISQLIGKTLGYYPWFKDDQKNFPGATEEHGVCVGDHVAITLVYELVDAYKKLEQRVKELESQDYDKLRE